ncbi:hypothetical protein BGX28_007390 [Mortierella sp. GBA30]|nr:hypothetical protein BGX28_007390 [Mortierella sp. GBA30]
MPTSDADGIEFTAKEERVNHEGIKFLGGQERTNYPFTLSVEDFGLALGLTAQILQPIDPIDVCGYMEQALYSLVLALEGVSDMPVSQLEVIPAEERTILLHSWNATDNPYPDHLCVHQIFEQQVRQSPDAVAVEYGDQSLSYAELNARANHLARRINERGVSSGDFVATYLERSFELVISQLAILKAGATYVPIDIKAPVDRQAYVASDSGARLLIIDEHMDVPVKIRTPVLRLAFNKEQNAREQDMFDVESSSNDTAYVMYTSGSTGLPKGVMVSHCAIARLLINNGYASIGPNDRIIFGANPAFDASTFEVWAPLLHGARMVIVDFDTYTDPYRLADVLNRCMVTVLFLTPVLLNQYIPIIGQSLAKLRYLLSGGEQGSLDSYATLLQLGGPVRIVNAYGPTESTMIATTFEAYGTTIEGLDRLPIGRPISNTQVYVLDKRGLTVPLGAVGELYIGGPGVANGYLNQPDLTSERFLPDPFSKNEAARMYKSGDLVRYLPDGNLVYMGRNDDQIKIRGFRIELREVEARLVEHYLVRDAVVMVFREGSDKSLLAYVAADPCEQLIHALREHLVKYLPEYMIPAAIVRLDVLPMTNNGKVDRRALPAPDSSSVVTQDYMAPEGDMEVALAAIWSDVLMIDRVGRNDNFFLLGGHSLLAVRLMNRISTLGAHLPLSTLFASPTLSTLADAVSNMLGLEDQSFSKISRVAHTGVLELSFAQQRLWFLAQMAGVSETYHIPLTLRLKGSLDKNVLRRTLNTLFARHESLRSVFVTVEGQPQVQLIPADSGLDFQLHDLRSESNKEAGVEGLSKKEATAPFDLEKGPLIRARLIQLADDEYVFLMTQHHIVSDGWSMGILMRELSALYSSFCATGSDPLSPLAIQYPDYAAWQRQWLSEDRLQKQCEYWRETLLDAPVSITLPTDRPRPSQQSFAGANIPIRLDARITQGLKDLSQKYGTTLFMTLLTAWSAVLSRLSGQDDVVIGTPSANRNHHQVEQLIGFFVNTLALRVDLSGEPSVEQLLDRVRQSTLAAQAHQDLPFEQVVEIVQPPRRMDQTPLFQVMFAWQNNDLGKLQLLGLEATVEDLEYNISKFDLELELYEDKDEIVGSLRYSTALFDRETIERHAGYLQTMLRSMTVIDVSQFVTTIELMGPLERELTIQTWNKTDQPYPDNTCIHHLFEDQVKKSPEAIAIVHDDQTLTYRELNSRANGFACLLREAGVKPGDFIPTHLNRSINLVAIQIAILKTGATYVPIDPKSPADRQAYIATDSGARLLVTDEDTIVPSLIQTPLFRLKDCHVVESTEQDMTTDTVDAGCAAYVMYTSGSTGLPKGVMVSHRAIARLVFNNGYANIGPDDRVSFATNPSFDPSTFDVWAPLLNGARIIVIDHDTYTDAHRLAEALARHQVTSLMLTTALFHRYAFAIGPALSKLKYLVCGGEQGLIEAFSEVLRHGGPVHLINAYGPTEATVNATTYEATSSINKLDRLPIGRPQSNTQVYVLDKYRNPVPIGVVGELYIGGPGVANGYLNRSDLTAERFLPDPFHRVPGARMYKSGDLVRYLSDGNLLYMGRNDDQVKIRGYRIELGEIEARLAEHNLIKEAVVLVLGCEGDRRLVAYVVAAPMEQLAHILREHLAASLPDYMVPVAFVRMDEMPLTSNGKVDRRKLPEPDSDSFVTQNYEAPQGKLETVLAAIWAELLKIGRVGRHDNFFMLGGHSLLAVRMIESLRHIGLSLSVRALFDTPVLGVLAASISKHQTGPEVPSNLIMTNTTTITPELLPLIDLTQDDIDGIVDKVPGGVQNIQDIYSLSPLQDGILFHHMMATKGDPYLLLCCLAFRDRDLLERYLNALQQVVDRHDILRTSIFWKGISLPAQVVLRQATLSISEHSLDPADGPIVDQLVQMYDARKHRIDLTNAPLTRYAVAQDADGRWILLQLLHHIIGDHSTLEVMEEEIQAILAGKGNTLLPPQPFRNLVAQARLGTSVEAHEAFFTKMLADIETPALPYGLTDVHREGVNVTESHRTLTQDLHERLRNHARRLGVSLAALCHLAWAQVIAGTSGQHRVVFGTVLFGRMQGGSGSDRTMGLFINTLPLRIDVEGSTVLHKIHQVQNDLATLLEHEHASLAMAQRCSSVPSGTPLFSAILNYRHNAAPSETTSTGNSGIEFLSGVERTNYPFVMSVEDSGSSLGLTAQVIQPYESSRICQYMEQALQSLAETLELAPDTPIQALDILPSEERDLMIRSWNQTEHIFPCDRCVQQLFEDQVKKSPYAIAVVYDSLSITYSGLNNNANNLARQLVESGVKPGDLVATLLKRSFGLVIAQLAILKIGATYVPIDTNAPVVRQAYIASDSCARLLITGECTVVPEEIQTSIFRLKDCQESTVGESDHFRSSFNAAYVMYTSGSTGLPKGVMVSHSGIARLVINNGYARIGSNDRVVFGANPAFDASTFEVWAPLLNGGTIVIVDSDTYTDPYCLADVLNRNVVTVLFLTPVLLNQYVSMIGSSLAKLRYIISGGEQGSLEAYSKLLQLGGPVRMINAYGPTESTMIATTFEAYGSVEGLDRLPIGRPIGNTQAYVLDKYGMPVPIGAVGELYIGGVGVANGYLNRPELTAERFLPDPFSKVSGARMYKSGDLVRFLQDGNLVFMGRNDDQVKIRGYRIELGEIEARLVEHKYVKEAIVLALGEKSDMRLVAYVVADPEEQLAYTLREYIATGLPDYMVPAAFVRLDELPVTPNGKVDRRALPEPDTKSFVIQDYEAPQGDVETELAAIWVQLLKIERVGRYDNFFTLGGHSLLAVRMIESLRRLGLILSVRALFDTPVLSVLATSLNKHQDVSEAPINLITTGITKITPQLLPLIDISQDDIDHIVDRVPGGIGNIQDIYALSPLQDGILFHHIMATKGDPYLLLGCMAFRDKDLIDRYLSAVQQVVDRHDILRTAIFWENLTAPAQVVLRHAPLCVTELSLDPAEGPIADQLMQLYNPRQHRIELIGAPLTQFVIAQDTDGRWILLQLLHHIAGDHSTLEIMEDEIQTILAGKGDTLPTPQPFRNLIAQARLGMSADEHETFFSKMLSDIEMPSLPYGLTDVHREGINITESHRMLPQELSDRLRGHAKGLGVSLASLCHLAWALVIAGTSGQQRVVFGTVLFGRMQGGSGSDRAMGLFINTLPIRIDVKEGSSVLESVHRVQTDLATLLEHEHASLAMAQRCSNVPSGVPLFSAILNYRHNTEAPLKDAGTTDTGIEAIGGVERTNYPFTMSIEDFGSSLGLTSQAVQPYDPSRICGYMQQALQSLAEMLERAPNMPIQAIGILPVEEKDMMVKAWNNTKRSIPGKGCVHQLFEEQTEKSPEAIAIMFNGRSMTYRTLNNKANRLARTLVDLGVKSGDYVAILLKRSFELVIAQLAILKAGAAYVPIDVKAPVDRQAYIASDSGSRLLITDDDTDVSVKIRIPLLRLIIENEEQDAGAQDEFIGAAGSSKDTAYVMYTSGSTGLPKGVMVPHRGIARLIINNGYADLGHSDRIIFGANPAFDASTFEVWAPLLHGAMMVIVDFDTYTDPYRLADVLDRQRVTILFLTPVLLNQYVSIIGPSLAKLRYLLSGGEQGSLESYASLLQLDGPVRIVNAYGPTESTMVATTFEANGRAIVGLDRLPIGRPIANTQVYVLDKHRYPVPLGAVGELYIGGPGVANGYLNRPDLTSERFVPDPFSKDHEAHMYKSGDLVRYLPDGNLIYMGRDDDQVKIRGFRIEIREIEERLVEHRLVREAIILGLGDGDGSNKRLVAYVEADPCKKLVHILREHLAVSLPEYMIPAAFVRLDTFPVNSNGKVDRRALPAPDSSSFVTQDYEPPQGEQETSLAAIWSELLKIEKIGRHDNFFMLGGHSLLAVKMISSVRSRLGHDLKLQLLFTAPTIAELSQMLLKESSSSIQDDEYPVMIPLKPQGSRLPLFCIHSGLGLSWVYMGLAKYLHPEQPLYGLQARGLDGKGQLAGSVEEMARDYIDHIRQIQPHGPYNLLGWSFGGTVAHSMAVELERQGEKVPLLVIMDSVADYSIIGDSEASELDAAANTEHIARIGGNGKDALDAGSMVWERTKDVHRNHFSLAREYSPGVFMGGVVYFRATVKTDEKTPMPDPASWAPLALGGIEVHDVECTHLEMDKPGSMTVIGQAVAAKLEGK